MKKIIIAVGIILSITSSVMAQTFTLKSHEIGGQFTNAQFANAMGFTGENKSPELYWENAPNETQAFAVTIYDMDAPTGSGFWHWIVYNIPAGTNELKPDAGNPSKKLLPEGAVLGNSDLGVPGYVGAAPQEGPAHRFLITVYALSKRLELDKNATSAYIGFNLNFTALSRASLLVYAKK